MIIGVNQVKSIVSIEIQKFSVTGLIIFIIKKMKASLLYCLKMFLGKPKN